MGDPRKQKNKYSTPRHPWIKARIDEEKTIVFDYGLKNKLEIYKQASIIKGIKDLVKVINSGTGVSNDLEKANLLKKLHDLNLIKEDESLDAALDLTTNDIMERRLQTQLVRQNLARTMSQARQFIVHGHIRVNGIKMNAPSYLVNREEQFKIEFIPTSNFADPNHPERKPKQNDAAAPVVAVKSADEALAEEVGKEISGKLETKEASLGADGDAATVDEDEE